MKEVSEFVLANAGTREMFAALLTAKQRADQEVSIAWTAFCHATGEPLTSELMQVSMDGLIVKRLKPEDG